ncbi:hypothetical protein SADUNF_Sadunf04G0121100 [Salix dunnii]|uniref:Uncharacterized protein n=1 Tax=Salix dunnii TaxID=1413687 RepID=A0A835KEJ0_9ROSI|nr:hypothetical protein SADUNF_Sadunf04G0121100 [Salix dunnii]
MEVEVSSPMAESAKRSLLHGTSEAACPWLLPLNSCPTIDISNSDEISHFLPSSKEACVL